MLVLPHSPRQFGFFVDGVWHKADTRLLLERRSPAHHVLVTQIPQCTAEDVDLAVKSSRNAFEFGSWAKCSGAKRADILLKAAELIQQQIDDIAYWETLETGKPITQARGEIQHAVACFKTAAGAARLLHGDSHNNLGEDLLGLVTREPVGVVGVITPWNFPFLILCERVPFILASGCTLVVKPSESTSATTLMLADILQQAGLPKGVYNVVSGSGSQVGEALIKHNDVDMLSFTGSTRVGRLCIEAAAASNMKKLNLELGGKNPIVVFADADLEAAADAVVLGSTFNAGQCCVSSSRLIVERSIAEEFEKIILQKFSQIKMGDPLDEKTQMGVITTESQQQVIASYIELAKAQHVEIKQSSFQETTANQIFPMLFSNVTNDMKIAREEIFGPILCSIYFDTPEQAIAIANDTPYGLAASVWSKNIDNAIKTIRQIKAGRCWVNTNLAGGPEMPLGGFKASGWGRDAGIQGVEEYTQVKSIHIAI